MEKANFNTFSSFMSKYIPNKIEYDSIIDPLFIYSLQSF